MFLPQVAPFEFDLDRYETWALLSVIAGAAASVLSLVACLGCGSLLFILQAVCSIASLACGIVSLAKIEKFWHVWLDNHEFSFFGFSYWLFFAGMVLEFLSAVCTAVVVHMGRKNNGVAVAVNADSIA